MPSLSLFVIKNLDDKKYSGEGVAGAWVGSVC